MTLAQILAPVAAASALNTLLCGMAWRATQIEKSTGRAPWYLGAGIVAYALIAAGFVYAYRGQPITTALEVFGASAVSEVMGAALTYLLLHGIFRKDPITPSQRGFQIVVSAGMLCVLFAGIFV